MKIAITITSRMKSIRLPLKVIRLIIGTPLIEHLIERLKLSKLADEIILCTSVNPQDEILVDYAKKMNIKFFRGDEEDVLKRLYDAASAHSIDFIVSTTADNPLTDPIYIDKIIQRFKETNADYITALDLPIGAFSYGLKVTALKDVVENKKERNTEIWGVYFQNSNKFKRESIDVEAKLKNTGYRLTVDTQEDFKLMNEIYSRLSSPNHHFSLIEVVDLLSRHPELAEINKNIIQRKAPEIDFTFEE